MARNRFHGGVMHTGHGDRARQDLKTQRLQAAIEANQKAKDAKGPRNSSVLSKIDGLMHGRPPRFALVRTLGGLGDALMVTPTFKALKEKYPDCHITYGTTKEYSGGVLFDVLQNNPYIDDLVPYQQIKKESFDIYADLTAIGVRDEYILGAPKDRQTMWGNYVGIDIDDGQCVYTVEEDERKWAKDWLADHKKVRKSRFIVIQPGSFADRRNWPRDTMIEFIKEMHSHDNSLVFLIHDFNVGEYKDTWSSLTNCINISEYNIRSIAALMEQSDLVIAHDSGLLHLAGALDCKIVSIFGSTHPQSRINWFKNCIAVWQKNLACAPCWYKACKNHYYCVKALAIEDVFNATLFMLDEWKTEGKNDLSKLKNVDYFYGVSYGNKKRFSAINKDESFPVRRITKRTKKTKYNLSILMVTLGSLSYLKDTVRDVFKYTKDFELIIYQNARVEGSPVSEYLDDLCMKNANINTVKDKKNSGFLKPNNIIAKKAKGEYICLLNDDMTLCKDWAKTMTDKLKADSTLAQVGISNTCKAISHDGCGIAGDKAEYIEASCMIMPRKIYDEHGLFDEENLSFAYFEDSDLSLRLREKGWNVDTVDIPVVHHRAKTSSVIKEDLAGYQAMNRLHFTRRWANYFKTKTFKYRIGVKRDGAIGDVLLVTPVLEAIKNKYPLSNITVITKCGEVLCGNPYVHKIATSGQKEGFDMFFDLDDSYETDKDKHVLESYANTCDIAYSDIGSMRLEAEEFRLDICGDYVVFHPGGTSWSGRNWKADRFNAVAERLSDAGYKIILVGDHKVPEIKCDVDLRGKVDLAQVAHVIKNAKLFVGIDSLPFHIAQSQNTPGVVFFGCVDPKYRIVNNNIVAINADDLACIGCHHWNELHKNVTNVCVREDGEQCIERITVDIVYKKVLEGLHE